jgi:hypothetical protein
MGPANGSIKKDVTSKRPQRGFIVEAEGTLCDAILHVQRGIL